MADPLLEVIAEPRLNTICKPDGFSFDEFARRPGGGADKPFSNFLQVFTTNEHAQKAISVKLQVAVDVSEGERFPAGIFLIDNLYDLLHLLLVVRVVLANRLQQLLDQNVVDLHNLRDHTSCACQRRATGREGHLFKSLYYIKTVKTSSTARVN